METVTVTYTKSSNNATTHYIQLLFTPATYSDIIIYNWIKVHLRLLNRYPKKRKRANRKSNEKWKNRVESKKKIN